MNIHFIAIGGKVMHALAIALHQRGFKVTGSDDALYDPSAGRLRRFGLLPKEKGWFPQRIVPELDAVILGMHAKEDNPELQRARELGLPLYSFPEYMGRESEKKRRVVLAGSHGKTTMTAMVMHVLHALNRDFDFMVGGEVRGFDTPIRLTPSAPVMIFEGDEYPASRLDTRPKFVHYRHHIGVLSGIAWDHINVYPTFSSYLDAFRTFIRQTPPEGVLFYFKEDKTLRQLVREELKERKDIQAIPYETHKATTENGQTLLKFGKERIPIDVFGKHNLANISAAKAVCQELGVEEADFYRAIATFGGAGQRLEVLHQSDNYLVLRDYAHAPSKWRATTDAVRERFPKQKLIAFLELHTYSSLNPDFFPQFRHTLAMADEVVIFCHRENLALKGRSVPSRQVLREAFSHPDLSLLTSRAELQHWLREHTPVSGSLLFMSSGNFDAFDFKHFTESLSH